jgi:hypothetical protein
LYFRNEIKNDSITTQVSAGTNHSACLVSGEVYIFGLFGETTEHFYAQPRHVDFPEPVKKIELGDLLCVFLTKSGDIYTLGSDQEGQLGRKQKENKSLGKGKSKKYPWIVLLMRSHVETIMLLCIIKVSIKYFYGEAISKDKLKFSKKSKLIQNQEEFLLVLI